jgi:hypothetical protein
MKATYSTRTTHLEGVRCVHHVHTYVWILPWLFQKLHSWHGHGHRHLGHWHGHGHRPWHFTRTTLGGDLQKYKSVESVKKILNIAV